MNPAGPTPVQAIVDAVYRAESRRIFATLVRLLGDLDLAEEGLHDAFRAALEQWGREGVPEIPRPGWSRRAASRRSIAGGAWRGSTPWTRTGSRSRHWPTSLGKSMQKSPSLMTGCG
jgi:predicted RNA polymerase sigma factor